jgi:hypothetical protein
MAFLIIFGAILVCIAIFVRCKISFTPDSNSNCPDINKKEVRENKINFYVILIIGCLSIIAGTIGLILF